MSITIELPHVGESVVEGTIGKWLKKPGDTVKRYEPLVEIITDKVTMEVPSPVDGSVVRLLAEEGETLPMGAPIAEVATADSPEGAEPETASIEIKTAAPDSPGTTGYLLKNVTPVGPTGGAVVEIEEPTGTTADAAATQPAAPAAPVTPAPAAAPPAPSGSTRLSPAVRRLAQEHSVDVSQVQGTGLGGRITRDDVLKFVESGPATAPAAAPARQPAGETSADGDRGGMGPENPAGRRPAVRPEIHGRPDRGRNDGCDLHPDRRTRLGRTPLLHHRRRPHTAVGRATGRSAPHRSAPHSHR